MASRVSFISDKTFCIHEKAGGIYKDDGGVKSKGTRLLIEKE